MNKWCGDELLYVSLFFICSYFLKGIGSRSLGSYSKEQSLEPLFLKTFE